MKKTWEFDYLGFWTDDDEYSAKKTQEKLANGVNVNSTTSFHEGGEHIEGYTALHAAANSGGDLPKTVQILLDAGAEINARDNWGWQAIHYAARGGHAGVVKKLVEHGAEINTVTENNWTPVELAKHNATKYPKLNYGEIVEILSNAEQIRAEEAKKQQIETRKKQIQEELKRRKEDPLWQAVCSATKVLVASQQKEQAKILIQNYLKQHQK